MIMMAKTHASDQRESEFCRILLFLPMQRRRRQLRKRLLKSEFALPQTLSRFRLIQSRLIRQMLANFFGVEF